MREAEMAVWLGDAEDDAVMGFVSSPFIQRHEGVCRPSSLIFPSVFKDHIQVLAALGTTTVLSDISRILDVVVESHP